MLKSIKLSAMLFLAFQQLATICYSSWHVIDTDESRWKKRNLKNFAFSVFSSEQVTDMQLSLFA